MVVVGYEVLFASFFVLQIVENQLLNASARDIKAGCADQFQLG